MTKSEQKKVSSLKSDYIYIKEAQCAEKNEKSIFQCLFFIFLIIKKHPPPGPKNIRGLEAEPPLESGDLEGWSPLHKFFCSNLDFFSTRSS